MKLPFVGLLLLCGILSCASSSTTTKPVVIVSLKGIVATGAHKRTPLSGARVGYLKPQKTGWVAVGFGAVTTAEGRYTFKIDSNNLDLGYPLFVCASDSGQTFTMISEIPRDIGGAGEGAEVTIDINPSTTVASQMICPGGVSPPPANTWCYSNPTATASADNAALIGIVDRALAGNLISLETGDPPQWGTFASGFLNDPATFTEIKNNLTEQGITIGDATPSSIGSTITAARLPLAAPPTNNPNSGSSSSGGTGCRIEWDCGTSSQCATVYGTKKGSAAQPDAATCNATCKSQGACSCQGC
jgi:hypothetical protein